MKSIRPMPEPSSRPNAEGAINRVLQAEREARNAMLECDQQADGILREARERARRIRQRAEQRIQQWYVNSDRRAAERVGTLDEQGQALQADPPQPSGLSREWQLAVQRLADELIGGTR